MLDLDSRRYEWIEDWRQLTPTEAGRAAWPHTGIVATAKDEIVTFDAVDSSLITFDKAGQPHGKARVDIREAHGITLVVEDGSNFLWLADASVSRSASTGYTALEESPDSRVVKVSMDGRAVMALQPPANPAYETGHYRPTCVAVAETRFGENGDIWVGDGYGESYVHHYDRHGNYLGSLSGDEGGGRYNGPHAIFIDRRRPEPELYVADRANARIQVYGLDGRFRRVIEGFLSRPTWLASDGDFLIVVEFTPPRLTVLDSTDHLVGYLAEGPLIIDRAGWPNELDADGKPKRPALVAGKLNSPHSVAVDSEGSLYVTEYLIGSRTPKLRRLR